MASKGAQVMKVRVTIKQTQTVTFEIGGIPANLIKDLLVKNDGTFDGNWTLGDIKGAVDLYTTDSVEVEELE